MVDLSEADQDPVASAIDKIARDDGGRLLACLIGYLRDFQLAEDSLQDAIESALIHWQRSGLPNVPAAWLLQTARRKAIDRLRRSANFQSKQAEYTHLVELDAEAAVSVEPEAIPDERLRLIFTCCHPALDRQTSVALTLRTLGGLTTGEIARAFVVKDETMAQRLVRARHKIARAGIPYQTPEPEEWHERLDAVLAVIYLIFNAGYAATGTTYIRVDLCDEAIRLARILLALVPAEPEIEGLLALMLLHHSRAGARLDPEMDLVALAEQDRTIWDRAAIAEGVALTERALRRGRPGVYQLQAAISAIHAEADDLEHTNWAEIVLLYQMLERLRPNRIVTLNRIAAQSFAVGAREALAELETLGGELESYQPFHATRADILQRSGDVIGARSAYETAIALSDSAAEKRFLQRKLRCVG